MQVLLVYTVCNYYLCASTARRPHLLWWGALNELFIQK